MPLPLHLPPYSHHSTPPSPLTPRLPKEPSTWLVVSASLSSSEGGLRGHLNLSAPPKDFYPHSHQSIMNPPLKLQMTILLHLQCISYRNKVCFYKTWGSFTLLTSTQQNSLLQQFIHIPNLYSWMSSKHEFKYVPMLIYLHTLLSVPGMATPIFTWYIVTGNRCCSQGKGEYRVQVPLSLPLSLSLSLSP